MKKLLSLLLAVMLLCSLTVTAFADSTIDLTRTGSIELWKYDLTSAQADGVWDGSYVSTGVRDENGVEAAAYTIVTCGAMLPEDEITFTLDRPFLFVIRTYTGVPVFIGVVEQPQDVSES